MLLNGFSYSLPVSLIAKYPTAQRSNSRLLYLNGANGNIAHSYFTDIVSYLNTNDLLIMNDSKVMPARLFGYKESGGKVEILLERILSNTEALAQVRANKPLKINTKIIIATNIIVELIEKVDDLFKIQFHSDQDIATLIYKVGHVPLPPYLGRGSQDCDKERYQTVYAKHPGSVAAPTAGLHFDKELLANISALGIEFGYVTLHIGAGTFKPIKTANIAEHQMHTELVTVSQDLCAKIKKVKEQGGRIIAVGTTTVRALETAALAGELQPFAGETAIFIKPGFQFKVVDALITNFHLPMSTLLILTCAFGGCEHILHAYQEAIKLKYRFYSYGDAMFIGKKYTV